VSMAGYWQGIPPGTGGGFWAACLVHGRVLNFAASTPTLIGPAISYAIGQGARFGFRHLGSFYLERIFQCAPASRKLIPPCSSSSCWDWDRSRSHLWWPDSERRIFMQKPIVVVGSINLDLAMGADVFPRLGRQSLVHSFNTFYGGKAQTRRSQPPNLGYPVSMVGTSGRCLWNAVAQWPGRRRVDTLM